ncbi:glycosyltransferase family 39 protein, partial [Modestobacter sp. KNN46-3]|uniref:glycosyltransferase family 39 protein n=1 Tax=Modestobacter sp. KNN46-3 TaxID=2711218 RepID=UPI001F150310
MTQAAGATIRPRVEPGAERPAGRRWRPWEVLPPALLLALGTVLLLPGHGLWFDELFTAEVSRRSLGTIVSAVVQGRGTTSYLVDVPPSYNAPYYLVTWAWSALPGLGGDTSLRVLSLLAAAGGLALITRAVSRLAGTGTGVLAGVVVASSPLLLEQAVEARSYGLAVLATGGALLGLTRWLQDPPTGLMLFGLAGAGMGLAHWYAATVLAAFVLAALVLRGRPADRPASRRRGLPGDGTGCPRHRRHRARPQRRAGRRRLRAAGRQRAGDAGSAAGRRLGLERAGAAGAVGTVARLGLALPAL